MYYRVKYFFIRMMNNIEVMAKEVFEILLRVNSMKSILIDIKESLLQRQRYDETICEICKKVSSIELELLMQRNASLDNNFPGKEDL